MADKFTRSGNVEGDIWYATTASSSKSLESVEDNIDDKMIGFIGADAVGGDITNSTTETKIGEVIVAANSVRNRLLIIASIRLRGGTTTPLTGTFRIRTGTSATATSNTQRVSKILTVNGDASSGQDVVGGVLMATLVSADEVFTGQVYVHVTGENSVTGALHISFCDFIFVLGI